MTGIQIAFGVAVIGAAAGGGTAWLLRSPPADLAAERARIGELEEQLELVGGAIQRLEREFAIDRAANTQLRSRLEAELRRLASEETKEFGARPIPIGFEPPPPVTPRSLLEAMFEEVVAGGSLAAVGPIGTQFVGLARVFAIEGVELLENQIGSPLRAGRLSAIRLAGRLGDPALIEPLTEAARSDASDLVRIFAAEALAAFPAAAATESWLSILEAEGPSGVRVHAWTGLARAGHPSAIAGFSTLLDSCDAAIPADAVVDTALSMADPKLLPAICEAFLHPAISEGHRIAILRTLAREGGEWREFVGEVALDAAVPEAVRRTATLLVPPPPTPIPEPDAASNETGDRELIGQPKSGAPLPQKPDLSDPPDPPDLSDPAERSQGPGEDSVKGSGGAGEPSVGDPPPRESRETSAGR